MHLRAIIFAIDDVAYVSLFLQCSYYTRVTIYAYNCIWYTAITVYRLQVGIELGRQAALSATDWRSCRPSTIDDRKSSATTLWAEVQSRWSKKTLRWCRSWYRPGVQSLLRPESTGRPSMTGHRWSVEPRLVRRHACPEQWDELYFLVEYLAQNNSTGGVISDKMECFETLC